MKKSWNAAWAVPVSALVLGCGGAPYEEEATPRPPSHSSVQVPVTLDGVAADPRSLELYENQPLYSVQDPEEDLLHVFTSEAGLQAYVRQQLPRVLAQREGSERTAQAGWLYYYEHNNMNGALLSDTNCSFIPDLRAVNCWFGGCSNWNDRISSVSAATSTPYIILHEHSFHQGSTLVLWGTGRVSDLTQFGWNDRASSISCGYALKSH